LEKSGALTAVNLSLDQLLNTKPNNTKAMTPPKSLYVKLCIIRWTNRNKKAE